MSSTASEIESVLTDDHTESADCIEKNKIKSKEPLVIEIQSDIIIVKRRSPRIWYQIPEFWCYTILLVSCVVCCFLLMWLMVKRAMVKQEGYEMRKQMEHGIARKLLGETMNLY